MVVGRRKSNLTNWYQQWWKVIKKNKKWKPNHCKKYIINLYASVPYIIHASNSWMCYANYCTRCNIAYICVYACAYVCECDTVPNFILLNSYAARCANIWNKQFFFRKTKFHRIWQRKLVNVYVERCRVTMELVLATNPVVAQSIEWM